MGQIIIREVVVKAKVIGIVHLQRLLARETSITAVETTIIGVRGVVTETRGLATTTAKIMVIIT